jgi:ABC-2 type transport system ATP-binding protein
VSPILEVQQLEKKYGDHTVVKGINFSVEEGEVFGLLGPNGAGKTQTISMITGVVEPTAGTACIDGLDILSEQNKVKQVIGLVPQDLALYPTLSARANLNFFGRIYGLRGKALKERVEDVLHIVALTERADEPIEKYSGGMKRRVNIAAGLVHQPRLLFLDEPTVGVDPQSRNQIFESVMRLNKERDMSIVYTSHYMEEVELLCNRVAIIDSGQIIALDTIKNLIAMIGGGVIQVGLPYINRHLISQLSTLRAVKDACPEMAPGDGTTLLEPLEAMFPDGGVVKILTHNTQEAIVNVIDYLRDEDIPVKSLNILEPNLETVFLHLTGKKLRE